MELETILLKRSKTIYKSDDGYGIYSCTTKDRMKITIQGRDIPKVPSCWVKAEGYWINDRQYGKEFIVQYAEVELPQTERGIVSYLKSLKAGLGDVKAKELYKSFGNTIWDLLDNEDVEALQKVHGITSENVRILMKRWSQITVQRELMKLFGGCSEFTARKAKKISEVLGTESVTLVKRNPYLLCRLASMSFHTVDALASGIEGITAYSQGRLATALYCTLKEVEGQGHVCCPAEMLINNTVRLLQRGAFKELVQAKEVVCMLRMMLKQERFTQIDGAIYRKARDIEENEIVEDLQRLMTAPIENANYAKLITDDVLKDYTATSGIQLADQQRAAVLAAFLRPVSIVTGGPGTGKTTLTKAILKMDKVINGEDSHPLLLAPTGRAARRLYETTGHMSQTVHSAIGYRGDDDEWTDDGSTISANLIILDEASMLDQMIANRLMKKIASGTRLVLVGDVDQLPSVGAGNVLAELINSEVIPVTRLNVIFRQEGGTDNPVVINANRMHDGDDNLVFTSTFRKYDAHTENEQIFMALKLYMHSVKNHNLDDVMLLVPYKSSKRTRVTTKELNKQIQHNINPLQPNELHLANSQGVYHKGDRVMQLKNVDTVNNGDIGIISDVYEKQDEDDPTKMYVILEVSFGHDVKREYSRDTLNELTLAYACTVHKSQGSEYPVVILVLSNSHMQLLQRNLVYTAITRATQKVALVGDITGPNSALEKAINNTNATVRYSFLGAKLRSAIKK